MLRSTCGLVALGCSAGGPHHYHLLVDSAFTADQTNAVLNAALEWEQSSAGYVTFDGEVADSDLITVHPTTAAELEAEFGAGYIGLDTNGGASNATIQMLPTLDALTFHQTALHELGHALGLQHLPPGNIMCANTTCATLLVTCGDLVQLTGATVAGCFP